MQMFAISLRKMRTHYKPFFFSLHGVQFCKSESRSLCLTVRVKQRTTVGADFHVRPSTVGFCTNPTAMHHPRRGELCSPAKQTDERFLLVLRGFIGIPLKFYQQEML